MQGLSKKTGKMEKKINVLQGGYLGLQSGYLDKLNKLKKQKEKLLMELKTFKRLEENEERAMVKRLQTITEEVSIISHTT